MLDDVVALQAQTAQTVAWLGCAVCCAQFNFQLCQRWPDFAKGFGAQVSSKTLMNTDHPEFQMFDFVICFFEKSL